MSLLAAAVVTLLSTASHAVDMFSLNTSPSADVTANGDVKLMRHELKNWDATSPELQDLHDSVVRCRNSKDCDSETLRSKIQAFVGELKSAEVNQPSDSTPSSQPDSPDLKPISPVMFADTASLHVADPHASDAHGAADPHASDAHGAAHAHGADAHAAEEHGPEEHGPEEHETDDDSDMSDEANESSDELDRAAETSADQAEKDYATVFSSLENVQAALAAANLSWPENIDSPGVWQKLWKAFSDHADGQKSRHVGIIGAHSDELQKVTVEKVPREKEEGVIEEAPSAWGEPHHMASGSGECKECVIAWADNGGCDELEKGDKGNVSKCIPKKCEKYDCGVFAHWYCEGGRGSSEQPEEEEPIAHPSIMGTAAEATAAEHEEEEKSTEVVREEEEKSINNIEMWNIILAVLYILMFVGIVAFIVRGCIVAGRPASQGEEASSAGTGARETKAVTPPAQ